MKTSSVGFTQQVCTRGWDHRACLILAFASQRNTRTVALKSLE